MKLSRCIFSLLAITVVRALGLENRGIVGGPSRPGALCAWPIWTPAFPRQPARSCPACRRRASAPRTVVPGRTGSRSRVTGEPGHVLVPGERRDARPVLSVVEGSDTVTCKRRWRVACRESLPDSISARVGRKPRRGVPPNDMSPVKYQR